LTGENAISLSALKTGSEKERLEVRKDEHFSNGADKGNAEER
jgi:hypothetical protein